MAPRRAPARQVELQVAPTWPADKVERRLTPSSTDMADPAFQAVDEAISHWVIGTPDHGERRFAWGGADHVLHLLAALRGRGLLGPAPSPNQAAPMATQGLVVAVGEAAHQVGGCDGHSATQAAASSAAAVLLALPDYELWLGGPGDVRRSMGSSHSLARALRAVG